MKRMNYKNICLKLIWVTFICLFTSIVSADVQPQHLIIIDAGSSGSRLHIFEYQQKPSMPFSLQSIREIKQVRATTGLSELVDQPKNIEPELNKLFKAADNDLTLEQKKTTPIYLLATAGFRILAQPEKIALLQIVRDDMQKIEKNFGYPLPEDFNHQINIIHGRTEALFAWLTVNYLMQNLNLDSLTQGNDFGVLDMGGASTQMTFLTKEPPQNNFSGFIYQRKLFLLYTKSYANFGLNESERALQTFYGDKLNACYPQKGSANFDQCLQLIQGFLNKDLPISPCQQRYGQEVCNGLGEYQPSISQTHFIGVAYYYPLFDLFKLADQIASPWQLAQATRQFCQTPWAQLSQKYSTLDADNLRKICFRATWIYELLKRYGLNDKTPLIVTEKIAGESSDWPLGAAIYLLTQPTLPITTYET
jgi:Golgi nucleoside diphosphatase